MVKTESDIMLLCNHPLIIDLYYIFESQEYYYLVMPLVKGADLKHIKGFS